MDFTTFTESTEKMMEVRKLIGILSGLHPDDHVAVRWYDRYEFGDAEVISDRNWELLCDDFERDDDIDQMNRDYIDSKVWKALRSEKKE